MFCRQRSIILTSLWPLLLVILRPHVHAQSISTSGPVPPLQWINITGLTTGSAPPALKDASIGYYDGTRTLLIFGGESAQGIPQSETYLLNLESLAWSTNNPPNGLGTVPPARSAAISADDSAASYRSAHIVIGGLGSGGKALSDVWEFDYISQFWSEVMVSSGGPSARYGAIGGKDQRTPYTWTDTATPNNSFYLAGGISGDSVSPLSDVWQLNVTGALSSNNPNSVQAGWMQLSLQSHNIPSKVGAAGAVVSSSAQDIIAFGGCTSSSELTPSTSCAQADSYIINTGEDVISPSNACPVPRLGATLVPNSNSQSTDFNNQVFLVFGLYNSSLWSDDGGLEKGEVDVLNVETVGTSGNTVSDSIFFGGVDADGNYLNEVWVLRAYNAQLTQSNQSWTNGSGSLTGGIDSTGQGVTVQFMTQCARALSPQATQTSAQASGTSGGPSPTSPSSQTSTPPYDTSVAHKALSPISLALIFPAVIGARLAMASVTFMQPPGNVVIAVSSVVVAIAAYALGVAGLATSFTTITSVTSSSSTSLSKRSSALSMALKTAHGKAGLALFIILYGVVPLLFAISACYRRSPPRHVDEPSSNAPDGRPRVNSIETAEKEGLYNGRAGELHYPLNELNHRADPSTPGTTILDMTSTSGLMTPAGPMTPEMPRPFDLFLHVLFHALLFALCILSLIELWLRAPKAAFIVFLIGTVLFYVALFALAWSGRPRYSVLTALLARLRGHPTHPGYTPGTATPSRPFSATESEVPFPTEQRSPYQHYPPYRAASTVPDEYPTSVSHGHAMNEVDDDDEEDEDIRQRRIEDEMSRRDVSIVTVPRRKLFLTNPELDRG
ncbi:hypothetical protein EVJ58_g4411 [Rhodofomes roseus]|uniref:Uncharacterized protein n=1 Tax=Rhodofomes roseus TaxID=34475 RepID=A0A4Y9YGC2_9APHY|nr:hypothetical protein EVJ58_g4411 [Rhodofomes roseus]